MERGIDHLTRVEETFLFGGKFFVGRTTQAGISASTIGDDGEGMVDRRVRHACRRKNAVRHEFQKRSLGDVLNHASEDRITVGCILELRARLVQQAIILEQGE